MSEGGLTAAHIMSCHTEVLSLSLLKDRLLLISGIASDNYRDAQTKWASRTAMMMPQGCDQAAARPRCRRRSGLLWIAARGASDKDRPRQRTQGSRACMRSLQQVREATGQVVGISLLMGATQCYSSAIHPWHRKPVVSHYYSCCPLAQCPGRDCHPNTQEWPDG